MITHMAFSLIRRSGLTYWAMLLICVSVNGWPGNTLAQMTLKGHVDKQAEPVQDSLQGEVRDAASNMPVPDAQVTLPDLGFRMKTDAQGRYSVPRYLGKQPIIMSIEKPGYAPFAVSISETGYPPFTLRLQKMLQQLVLDTELRHLGDGSYSPGSSSAMSFRKAPDGPAIRIPFSLKGVSLSHASRLQIGSIIGLDTPMVHFLTGNDMDVTATPLIVKLNGSTIAQIQVNGDNQQIRIPKALLRANTINTLEFETGYQYNDSGRLDYDDMEFIHLVFHP